MKRKVDMLTVVKAALAGLTSALLMLPAIAASDDAIPVKKAAPVGSFSTKSGEAAQEGAPEGGMVLAEAPAGETPSANVLTAEEIIALALEHSYDLRIAEKHAESTWYEYMKYLGMAGGSLDLVGALNRSGPIPVAARAQQKETILNLSAKFSYPLTPLGNFGYGKSAAKSGYLASLAQVDMVRARIISEVFSAYVAYLTAYDGLKVADEGMALAEEQLKNAQLKFENDVAPRFEVIQGEVAVSQAKENLIKAANGVELARSALHLAMGVNPEWQCDAANQEVEYAQSLDRAVDYISEDIFGKLDGEGLYLAFVDKTPQFHALQGKLNMYHYQVLANRRAPFFSLDTSYTRQKGITVSPDGSWSFGISGKFNLWDSEKTESTQKGFTALADSARIEIEQYKQGFRLGIDNALNTLQASIEGYQTAINTLAQAKEGLRMGRLGYKEGVVTHADLVGARAAYLGAELNEFSKRMEVITSFQALLSLLGIGNEALYLPTTTSDLSCIVSEVIANEEN